MILQLEDPTRYQAPPEPLISEANIEDHPTPYEEGQNAHENGQTLSDNPYLPAFIEFRQQWQDGWQSMNNE